MRARFGEFVLDGVERVLLRGGKPVALEPKVFDCIALLVSQAGRLTTKQHVQQALWPDVHVGPGALRRVINQARKALDDRGDEQALIRTRKGLGYVFVAQVERDDAAVPSVPPPLAPGAPAPWPFVGRERELSLLLERLGPARAGSVCFVSGEAGAGKSSLLAQLKQRSAQRGGRWLAGHCQAAEGVPAFWPFREIAEQIVRDEALKTVLPLQPRERRALRVIPELAGTAGAPGRADPVSGEERFEVCAAFAKLLCRLSSEQPLLLIIEDVHWADDGSLLMLETIARAARDHALALVASYRPEAVAEGKALSQLIARTSGREGVTTVQLPSLAPGDLRALLAAVRYPGSGAGSAQVLHELTSGNALLVHELVSHALTTAAPLDGKLPASLQHIVAQRVSLLPEATRRLLGQAAVLGRDFSVTLLAALAGAPREQVLRELEPALRVEVIGRAGEDPDQLRFTHALVGDTLCASLPARERQAHHRDAWQAWQAAAAPGTARSGALAVHAFLAGSSVPAEIRTQQCERAGREAFAALAFDRAALHLGRAVRLTEATEPTHASAELALLWAKARFQADEPAAEVERACNVALERARRAGADALFAEAALGYAVGFESNLYLRSASLRPTALALAQTAFDQLVAATKGGLDEATEALRYRLAAALSWMRAEAGALSDFQEAAQHALRFAPRTPDPYEQLSLTALRAASEPERGDAALTAFLGQIGAPGLAPRQRIEAYILAMGVCLSRGDLAGFERATAEIQRLAELLPQPPRFGALGERLAAYVAIPLFARVTMAVIRGDFALAEVGFARLAERSAQLGFPRTREGDDNVFYMLLQLLGYQGRCASLEPLLEQHLRSPGANPWRAALVKAQFAVERDDRRAAAAHFHVLRETGFRPLLGGEPLLLKPETLVRTADVCSAVGDPADAALLYELLLPRARYHIHDGALLCYGSCSRALGELALQLGEPARAELHFADALVMNLRLGHRPELVRSRLGQTRALIALQRDAEARALIADARVEAERIGMTAQVALADRLAAR